MIVDDGGDVMIGMTEEEDAHEEAVVGSDDLINAAEDEAG